MQNQFLDNQSHQSKSINWKERQNDLPWFDLPNAHQTIAKWIGSKKIDIDQAELLTKWVNDGYVIIKNAVPEADIDEMNRDMEDSLTAETALHDLQYLGMLDENGNTCAFEHKDWVKLSPNERKERVVKSNFRVHEFRKQSQGSWRIYENQKLIDYCSLLFQKTAVPRSTINFYRGSAQLLHQDLAVFHVFPENYLIGMWLACEDIHEDSGPLSYCPGSHRENLWPGFDNYPQTTLRTCTDKEHDEYHSWVQRTAEQKYENKKFLAQKGDVLLWHALLFHGGSPIKNPLLTRKSFVTHYLIDGVDQTPLIHGPYRWG